MRVDAYDATGFVAARSTPASNDATSYIWEEPLASLRSGNPDGCRRAATMPRALSSSSHPRASRFVFTNEKLRARCMVHSCEIIHLPPCARRMHSPLLTGMNLLPGETKTLSKVKGPLPNHGPDISGLMREAVVPLWRRVQRMHAWLVPPAPLQSLDRRNDTLSQPNPSKVAVGRSRLANDSDARVPTPPLHSTTAVRYTHPSSNALTDRIVKDTQFYFTDACLLTYTRSGRAIRLNSFGRSCLFPAVK